MGKILELGCGFGRVTKLLAQNFPQARITALDLSLDQLENAKRYCRGCDNVRFQPYDFYSGAPLPEADYDAVFAIEVFLHHPPAVIRSLLEKLTATSKAIVNIDWSENWPWKTPEHVWVHDYAALYADAGVQCVTFPLPEKVDGQQQKLFIAAKALPSQAFALEQELQKLSPTDPAPATAPAQSSPAEAAAWLPQLQLAQQEILNLIPAGSTVILVDDDQWGDPKGLSGLRVVPFLERDGRYWGPPADDETAIGELQRLQQDGAAYIAFAWSSFWWLEHYSGFRKHLLQYPCLLENERLIVFRLGGA
jgi:SAM-dependent methyltransferase